MKIVTNASSNILLGAVLLWSAANLLAQTMIGDPGYKTVPSLQAIQNVNSACAKAGPASEECLTNFNEMSHDVKTVSDSNPVIPEAISFSGVVLPIQNPTPAPPAPPASNPVSGNSYVFGPLGTNLNIKITDQGYGLTTADKTDINVLLAQLPPADLAGIKQIVFTGPGGNPVTETNGVITISGTEGDTGTFSSLTAELSQGVGLNTYNALSDAEKADWVKYAGGFTDDYSLSDLFAHDYALYVKDSASWLQGAGSQALFVASIFKTFFYTSDNKTGGTVSMTYGAASRVAADPSDTLRDQVLIIGQFHYGIKNGQIVDWTEFPPPQPVTYDANGQAIVQAVIAETYTYPQPITIPATVLNLIPLS